MDLSDFFPEEFKEIYSQANITIGSVLRTHVTDTNPPKLKRFIIVGFCPQGVSVATLYINSDINNNVFPTEELKSLHYFLAKNNREILDYDSHVDCSSLKEKNYQWLHEIIIQEPRCVLGTIEQSELKEIRGILRASKTISLRDKKKYGLFL